MSLKMRKKYYSVIIAFAVLLIASIVTIGVLANQLLKKTTEETSYSIGNVEIRTLPKECDADLKLDNYSYSKSNTTEQKIYSYLTDNGEAYISRYLEYLVTEKGFVQTDTPEDNYSLYCTYSNDDRLDIVLSFSSTNVVITLTYTFHS